MLKYSSGDASSTPRQLIPRIPTSNKNHRPVPGKGRGTRLFECQPMSSLKSGDESVEFLLNSRVNKTKRTEGHHAKESS